MAVGELAGLMIILSVSTGGNMEVYFSAGSYSII